MGQVLLTPLFSRDGRGPIYIYMAAGSNIRLRFTMAGPLLPTLLHIGMFPISTTIP
jgi:hypothetical protein